MTHFRKEFGLEELNSSKLPTQSSAIYNGTLPFVLKLGFSSFINNMKLLWKYGFSLFKMSHTVKSTVKKFSKIYDLQAAGHSYRTVPEMLEAMGGESFFDLTQTTAEDYFKHNLGWNEQLVDEVVCAAMKVNYGQNNSIDAFTGLVSLAGIEDGYLWSVVGGNYQIAEEALKRSEAAYHNSRVLSVTTKANGSYSVDYAEGPDYSNSKSSEFDVVIIAHPLNKSKINFTPSLDIPGTKDEYHRTVATFIKGKPNAELFGYPSKDDYPKDFPMSIMTNKFTEYPPVNFNSISQVIPATATTKEAKKYCKPLCDLQATQVFKVFSNAKLIREDKDKLFGTIEEVVEKEWRAYPQYKPPETFPQIILDNQGGLLYINAIEMAASAMEMSVIGAKNVSLLAKDFILTKNVPPLQAELRFHFEQETLK
jgi:prenylcysteine oxidase/farnesylcysteine lyase